MDAYESENNNQGSLEKATRKQEYYQSLLCSSRVNLVIVITVMKHVLLQKNSFEGMNRKLLQRPWMAHISSDHLLKLMEMISISSTRSVEGVIGSVTTMSLIASCN